MLPYRKGIGVHDIIWLLGFGRSSSVDNYMMSQKESNWVLASYARNQETEIFEITFHLKTGIHM